MTTRFVLPPADPDVRAPAWRPRTGGWDTHAHVFGPAARFTVATDSPYDSPDQGAGEYLHMLDVLGLQHGVLVQPSAYGQDNAAMLAAVATTPDRLLAVIDIDPLATSDTAIAGLITGGAVGLRLRPGAMPTDHFLKIAARVREIGWHLDLYFESIERVAAAMPYLVRLDVPYIVEAIGEPKAGQPVDSGGFQALVALMRGGAWAKLSHAYHIDLAGPPYAAAAPFARALIAAAPDRLVWGSDWPHPMRDGPMPNDGALLDLLLQWADGDTAIADHILVDNPPRFYARPKGPAA